MQMPVGELWNIMDSEAAFRCRVAVTSQLPKYIHFALDFKVAKDAEVFYELAIILPKKYSFGII